MGTSLPLELILLGLSVILLMVHIQIQGRTVTRERGNAWNVSPRDGEQPELGKAAGRAQRALDNFKETWPAFIALALGLAVADRTGGVGAIGAALWFAARVAYLPLYLFGVTFARTAAYLVSLIGLILMLIRFF